MPLAGEANRAASTQGNRLNGSGIPAATEV
jgi:hypothetical protein